jgi:hypothetical protein
MIRNLGPISINQKEIYDAYMERYAPDICEHTFTSLFTWSFSKPVTALEAHGSLILFFDQEDGIVMYGSPLGDIPLAGALEITSSVMKKPIVAIELLTEDSATSLCNTYWNVCEDRNNFDYIYLRSDLAYLTGRKYHRKRNLIKRCLAAHDCTYEEITNKNMDEVRAMAKRWKQARLHIDTSTAPNPPLSFDVAQDGELVEPQGRVEAPPFGPELTAEGLSINPEGIRLSSAEVHTPPFRTGSRRVDNVYLHDECSALDKLFDNYEALGIMGGAVRVDGRIEAFCIADRLNNNTAVVHFEKANAKIKGLYQLINKWFAQNHLSHFEFINREQDNGIPGLIKAKQDYYPAMMQKKYRALSHLRATKHPSIPDQNHSADLNFGSQPAAQ